MKKAVYLVVLFVMVSTNIITPFSYAGIETGTVVDIEEPVVEQPKDSESTNPEASENQEPEVPEVSEPETQVEQLKVEPEVGTGVEEKVETPVIETPEIVTGVDERAEVPSIETPETGTGADENVETPIDNQLTVDLSGGNNLSGNDITDLMSGLDLNKEELEKMDVNVYTVTFDTNGGSPKDSVILTGGMKFLNVLETQHSYTNNIAEDGTKVSSYGDDYNGTNITNKVIIITGADLLKVSIKYSTFYTSDDFACVWEGVHEEYTARQNYDTSISDKLGGGCIQNQYFTKNYVINGDSATFSFTSINSWSHMGCYGYYATVTGVKNYIGEDPQRSNSIFLGWYTDDDVKWDNENDEVNSNMTLYAKWKCEPGYAESEDGKSCVEKTIYTATLQGNNDDMNDFKYKTIEIGDYVIMDRNLGANNMRTGTNNNLADGNNVGYYYQYGNNYGFFGTTDKFDKKVQVPQDKIPSKYWSGNWISSYTWTDQSNLWGEITDTQEARQGPCPEGWHIPTSQERYNIYLKRKTLVDKTTTQGSESENFALDTLLPFAGYYDHRQWLYEYNDVGRYWALSQSNSYSFSGRTFWGEPSGYSAFSFYFKPNKEITNTSYSQNRSNGLHVRCMQNIPTWKITYHLNGGSMSTTKGEVKKGTSITNRLVPAKENSRFLGWYTDEELSNRFDLSTILTGNIDLYAKWGCSLLASETSGGNCVSQSSSSHTINIEGDDEEMNSFTYKEITIGDYTLMDRNLGAKEVRDGLWIKDGHLHDSYGYYYQYGNNYGFSANRLPLQSTGLMTQSELLDSIPSKYSSTYWTPDDYKPYSAYNSGWDLWGAITQTDSARKGPCPSGWHVGSYEDWDSLYNQRKTNSNKSTGWQYDFKNFAQDLLLPPAGHALNGESVDYLGEQGVYVLSTRSNSSYYNTNLYVRGFGKDNYYYYIGNYIGTPVRCFKNRYTLNFDSRGGTSISPIRSSTQWTRPNKPTKKGADFVDWYTSTGYDTVFDFSTIPSEDKTIYAKWECQEGYELNEDGLCVELITLTFDPDGGQWEDGGDKKFLKYRKVVNGIRYSHTPNVSDDGTKNSDYSSYTTKQEIITITGAESLHITITYATNSSDYVCMWTGSHPEYSAYTSCSTSSIGKLSGTRDTKEYYVEGDSVTFTFYSSYGYYYDKYGYYAEVEGTNIVPDSENVEIQDPTKENYVFSGWYQEGFPTYYDLSEKPKNSKTLYARRGTGGGGENDKIAYLLDGKNFNKKIKSIASGGEVSSYDTFDYLITKIKRAEFLPIGANAELISLSGLGMTPVYAWYKDKILYYYTEATKISLNEDSSYMFSYLSNLTEIDMDNWDISSVKDMSYMFYYCSSLTNLNLGNWDINNVTDMSYMFYYCSSLTSLDLSNRNTSNVRNMSYMFYNCSRLTSLDVSNWDTSNVRNMSYMFYYCSSLTNLNIGNWNTSSVLDMSYMFYNCSSLTSLDLSNRNTSNVRNMSYMFYNCSRLTSLDVSNWDTSNVRNMSYMFSNCSSLTNLNIGNWNTSSVLDMSYMFYNCSNLTNLDVSSWNTSSVTNMSNMFYYCSSLTNLNLNSWDTSKVTNMSYMFSNCSSLTNLNIGNWNTSSVLDMSYMFEYCSNIENLDLNGWDTSNVVTMYRMFQNCRKLIDLRISNWNVGNVINMCSMFYNCSNLTSLDINNWDISNVRDMSYMFQNCNNLIDLRISNWNVGNVTNMYYMFYDCSSLTGLDLSNWDTSNVTDMGSMFYNCNSLTNLNLGNWNTNSVTNMSNMFNNCSELTVLDLSSWNTSSVTNMSSMFYNCSNLATIYASPKFRTSNITSYYSHSNMFGGVNNIVGGNGTTYTGTIVDKTYARIDSATQSGYFTQSGNVNNSAYLLKGDLFNMAIKSLAISGNVTSTSTPDTLITGFQRADTIPAGVITGIISASDSEIPVYAWFTGGIIYYNTTADVIELNGISSYMFENLKSLTGIDLDMFDTSHVTNMKYMFNGCTSLETVSLNDVGNVQDISYMFQNCSSLTDLDFSNWDTKNVRYMYDMFYGCTNLTKLNLSNWNVSNAGSNMYSMFASCSNLTGLIADNWDLSTSTSSSHLSSMLSSSSIKNISAKGWKLPKDFSYGISYMAPSYSPLEEMDVSDWDLSRTERISYAFQNTSIKKIIGVKTWTGTNKKLTKIEYLFENSKIEEIDMSDMDFSKVINAYAMLRSNYIKKINISNIKFDSLEDMRYLFENDSNLQEINLSNINTNKVINMQGMFIGCKKLESLDLSSFDTNNVINMSSMFKGSDNLKTIYVSDKFVSNNVGSSKDMFLGAISLVGGKGTFYDKNHIDKEYARIDTQSTPGYFTLNGEDSVDPVDPVVPDDGKDSSSNSSSGSGGKRFTPASTDSISDKIKEKEHNSANEKQDEDKSVDTQENQDSSIPSIDKDSQSDIKTSGGQKGGKDNNQNSIQYTQEQKDAYSFAKSNGITTTSTIKDAKMNTNITRIEMAKMLSYYAINVLGKTPDISKTIKFKDVSSKKDKQYNNGVTLAYQLGIMGQNVKNNKFRPNDEVTRAELVTSLSRMLYGTPEGTNKGTSKYYEPHMAKLYNEGIITNTDPNLKEKRGYLMTMLMRSVNK